MLFDQVRELPVATVRRAPRASVGLLVGGVRRWLGDRWQWLRPRTIPVIVAALGMLAVVHSVNYLSRPPVAAVGTLVIGDGPPGATVYIDGKAVTHSWNLELSPSRDTIRIVPATR